MRTGHDHRRNGRRPAAAPGLRAVRADLITWPGAAQPSSPEDVVVAPVFDELVAQAPGALPDVFRSVVRLVDLDGLTYAEAAEVLGAPTGTVMSRLHRSRTRIRDHLVKAGTVKAGTVKAGTVKAGTVMAGTVDPHAAATLDTPARGVGRSSRRGDRT